MQTVNSVIAQSYPHWELIIIDDSSTDNTPQLLGNITTLDSRISAIINNKNKGGNACRNQGLRMAKGTYIIFLDADDILDSHCLEHRIREAQHHADTDLLVFPMAVFKHKPGDMSASLNWVPPAHHTSLIHLFLKHQLPWQTMQPMWKKSFLDQISGFDESFVRLQDVELHTRALLNEAKVHTFPNAPKDCNFRIDENRFGNKVYQHLNGFTKGSVQYYRKFYPLVNEQQQRTLTGTLLETLSNVCYQYKAGKIKESEYLELLSTLINSCNIIHHKSLLKAFATLYRISPVHPKGLKKLTALLAGI